MSVSPYTQKRLFQHRGPQSSQDYNLRAEENYRDMVFLYNAIEQASNEGKYAYSALFKQLFSISESVDQFGLRLAALEQSGTSMAFYSNEQVDVARFNGTAYQILNQVDQLSWQSRFGVLTLPYVAQNSVSKIKFYNGDGTFNIANGLEVLVAPDLTSTDDANAIVETSSPFDAIQARPGLVWERNVVSPTADVGGAKCTLYIRVPNELSVTGTSNCLLFNPFPTFGVDITNIAYTTDPSASLNEVTTWTSFNSSQWYLNNADAVGHIPSGGWSGDTILDSGPKLFYFEPKAITALKITLRQDSYYNTGNRFLYSYGLSDIDIRYDKFLATGKTIIRLDVPTGHVINRIESVNPKIWNVSQAQLNDVFSYRTIWETSYNSGNYTLTPVSNSQRVWLEVTLKQVVPGFTPVISSIIANYT